MASADRVGPDPASGNTHRFATDRLTIEVANMADAAGLFALVGGEDRREVCATLVWDGPDEPEDVELWIERSRTASFADFGFHWVIRDHAGTFTGDAGRLLGAIGTRPTGSPGRADVGYWLGRPYWGRGIMSEALDGLLDYGFDTLDYYRIEAEVFANNERGRRLVEGRGMTLEGTIRRGFLKYGEWVDAALYGILREEWSDRR